MLKISTCRTIPTITLANTRYSQTPLPAPLCADVRFYKVCQCSVKTSLSRSRWCFLSTGLQTEWINWLPNKRRLAAILAVIFVGIKDWPRTNTSMLVPLIWYPPTEISDKILSQGAIVALLWRPKLAKIDWSCYCLKTLFLYIRGLLFRVKYLESIWRRNGGIEFVTSV